MTVQKPTIPKGTRDFGPEEVAKRKYILNTIEKVFIRYGFMPIETPTMENLSTLTGKYGDEGDQLLFKVLNSGDFLKELKDYNDKGLTHEEMDKTFLPSYTGKLSELDAKASIPFIAEKGLRYDLTVPFARYVVMHQNEITFPFRRYQMQPVWRADRPQKGRYREFWQCDADVVGSDSLLNELDLLQIYDEAFQLLGLKVSIRMNHRKFLEGITELWKVGDRFNEFLGILDKADKLSENELNDEFRKNNFSENVISGIGGMKIYARKSNDTDSFSVLRESFAENDKLINSIDEIKEVLKQCMQLSKTQNSFFWDFSLARGLSYYTGFIFEVVVDDERSEFKPSIGGGGRYDDLTGIFGLPNVSGVGISFGLDRIYDVMEELKLFPASLNQSTTKILFCAENEKALGYTLQVLKQIRNAGIAAEIYTEKVNEKKPLEKPSKYAVNKKIPFLCVVKSDEMQNGKLVLKDLQSGTQDELGIDEIISRLSR